MGVRGRSTLREVAKKAGVSIGTASGVFTSNASVSEEARAAVLAAASEIGYRPRRRAAPHLADGITTLGLIARSGHYIGPANPFYGPVLHGAQEAIAELGLSLVTEMIPDEAAANDDPSAKTERPLIIERRQAQGLLLVGYLAPAYLRWLLAAGLPCVLVDHHDPVLPIDSVCGDDRHGGYTATKHLIELGHRDPVPAIISAERNGSSIRGRLAGYRDALAEAGLGFDPAYVRQGYLDLGSGRAEMAALLDLPRPPTAVFCVNDLTALGAIDLLRERGVAVPWECSVIGYDDITMSAYSVPPLTTVAMDKEHMGMQAVWGLLQRIRHPEIQIRETRLRVNLITRSSTTERR